MAKEFTDANSQTEVLDSDKLSLVAYWAEWSGPCRAMKPGIEDLYKNNDGKVNIGFANVDQNPQISIEYQITSIPAILFYKDGKVVDKIIGQVPNVVVERKMQANL
jgi:thioredoxin 1